MKLVVRGLCIFASFTFASLASLALAVDRGEYEASRFFPKVPAGGSHASVVQPASYEDPAPELPSTTSSGKNKNGQPQLAPPRNYQQQSANHQPARRANYQPQPGYRNQYAAGASFQQSNPAGYQNGPQRQAANVTQENGPPSNGNSGGYTSRPSAHGGTSLGSFGIREMFGAASNRGQAGNRNGNNYSGYNQAGGNPRMAMNPGGPMTGSVMSTPPSYTIVPEGTTTSPISTGNSSGPTVTGDTVYLDGESIGPGKPMPGGPGMMAPGDVQFEGNFDGSRGADGMLNPYCNNCGDDCGACGNGNCGPGGCGDCGNDCCGHSPYGRPWVLAPVDWLIGGLWHMGPHHGACDPCAGWWWGKDLTVFAGVHNFKSNVDQGINSNFGFQQGLNWSMPFWHALGLGAQFGIQTVQSDFYDTVLTDESRSQIFLTGGLFHRATCGTGWQYGVVYDWLHDEFYEDFNVGQVRGEISYLWNCRNEVGFMYAAGVSTGTAERNGQEIDGVQYEAIDQYAVYFRRQFDFGGEGRIFGGATDISAGLVGVDFRVPIAQAWAFEGGFNYLMPEDSETFENDETWNVALNLVWYPGCTARGCSPYRPLLGVANNGSLMVNRTGGLQF